MHRGWEGGGAPADINMSVDDSDRESQARLSSNRFEVLSDSVKDSERHASVAL